MGTDIPRVREDIKKVYVVLPDGSCVAAEIGYRHITLYPHLI
jgi:hypothetical protein